MTRFTITILLLCFLNQIHLLAINENPAQNSEVSLPPAIVMPFYDADSVHIGTYYYTGNRLDSTMYIKSRRQKMKVKFDMPVYQGGFDSLKLFFEEEFQKVNTGKEELNAMTLVYILLENNKITDIKIGDRIAYNNKPVNYDKIIKEIIYKTQGKWSAKASEPNEPLLFVYLFSMKNKNKDAMILEY